MTLSAPHRVWLLGKAVAKGDPLSSLRRYGALPYELQQYKKIMPLLAHGKKITFGTIQTKHSHSRRSFIPNILYRPLYSDALKMMVWTCLSSQALREVDAIGGFDEYLTKTSAVKLGSDPMALLYKKRILAAQAAHQSESRTKMMALLKGKFGDEYLTKINSTMHISSESI